MIRLFLAVCGILIGASGVFAVHGHWTDHYSSASGTACCGARDCQKVHVRVLRQTQDIVVMEVNGILVLLPSKSFHPSEDGSDYWCTKHIDETISTENTRCVFLAVGT